MLHYCENLVNCNLQTQLSKLTKSLKYIFRIIITILFLGTVYFVSKWNKIDIDKNIGKSREVNNLNSKVFDPAFIMYDPAKIRTDLEIFERKGDTVSFNLNITKSLRSDHIYFLNFNSGDGFTGVNLKVSKFGHFFYTSSEYYTDSKSMLDFLESERYTVKKQKLTLDKSQYKKGDSIFGKIELQIKFNPTDSITNSKGYFRSIIE
ncbi:hypothetical protein ACM642_17200 [Chryseobacterium sp. CY353]|nr:hypothetical protein [Chryseobacterium sp. CY353]